MESFNPTYYLFFLFFVMFNIHNLFFIGGTYMPSLIIGIFLIFSAFILFNMNSMTYRLCIQKEIAEEKQDGVYRTINICITILLLSAYVKISYI